MSDAPACPAPEVLSNAIWGDAPIAERSAVERHLDDCESCRRLLEQMASDREDWERIASGVGRRGSAADSATELENENVTATHSTTPRTEFPFLEKSSNPGSIGRIGRCEIIEVVGRGAMGIVFKAKDADLARTVAVKVMLPERAAKPVDRLRFQREAQAVAAVCHDHVIAIHAVGETKEIPFLVMPFIKGVSLQQLIQQKGPLESKTVLRIGMQIASGLAAAHAQGLVHRDVKPANIMLENGVQRVKITDFGLARSNEDAKLTASDAIVGTPEYMAPEQARGERVDHRSDLFSLGSVMYAMCAGMAPFRGGNVIAVLRAVCEQKPTSLRDCNPLLPSALIQTIEQLLAKSPADRPASAAEVAASLERQLADLQNPKASAPVFSLRRRAQVGVAVAATAVVASLAMLILPAIRGGQSSDARKADPAQIEEPAVASKGQTAIAVANEVTKQVEPSPTVARLKTPNLVPAGFLEARVPADRLPAGGFLQILGVTEVGFPDINAETYALDAELELSSPGSGVNFVLGRPGEWRLECTYFHDLAKNRSRVRLARRGPRAYFTPGGRDMPGIGRRVRLIVLVVEGRSWLLQGDAIVLSTPVAPPAMLAIAGTSETSAAVIHACSIRPIESGEREIIRKALLSSPPAETQTKAESKSTKDSD